MAEVTGLRNNALPYPIYGQPFGIVFPMLDADGDLVTGATTPDAEVSKNGDTFADCTNESTEIATASGVYYLLLTATEMTADVVAVIAKSATAGMKTTVITLYPRKLVTLRTGTAQGGAAGSITLDSGASAVDDYYNGCVVAGVLDSTNEVRVITDYVGSTKVASVTPNWNVTPDSDDTFTVYLPEGRQVGQADVIALEGVALDTHDAGSFPADVRLWLGTAAATPTVAGVPEVDVTHWRGTATPAEHTAGYPIVTIKDGTGTGEIDTASGGVFLANGAHGGTSATLRLGGSTSTPAFYVTNSGGDAVQFESTGGDGHGMEIVGAGLGIGLKASGGSLGDGIRATGGASGGEGLSAISQAADKAAIRAHGVGFNSYGVRVTTGSGGREFEINGDFSVVGTTTLSGAVSLGSTLAVAGTVTFNAFTVTNATTLTGNVSLGGTLGVTGLVTFSAGFTVSGTTTFAFAAATKAEIQQEAEDALIAHNLDHLVKAAVDTDFATTVHINSVIGMMADDGTAATFDRTTDSLEAIRNRGDAAWLTGSTHSAADVWAAATRTLTGAVTVGTNNDKTGYVLNAVGSAALTEDYAADGAAPTLNQMLYQLYSALVEFSIAGTTITCKKLDGSTTAMTFTLDSSTTPTSRTRAT